MLKYFGLVDWIREPGHAGIWQRDSRGGGGSRGSGRVSLSRLKLTWRGKDYYAKGGEEAALLSDGDLAALQRLASADDLAAKLVSPETTAQTA